MGCLIIPSLLSADMTCLGKEVESVLRAGADFIHFDVMDNHYVPNLSMGPFVCESLIKKFPGIPLDVHLMVSPVDELIIAFAKAGAKRISIHHDATVHTDRSLELIRQLGCQAGLVLNPADSPSLLQWCLHRLDFVLVMTVNPGFAGQKLIPDMIDKIEALHHSYPDLPICVDGGVTENNIADLARVGASQFVAGSAVFSSTDYAAVIQKMQRQYQQA